MLALPVQTRSVYPSNHASFTYRQTIVALCWEIAEGICILARAGHRGIHPGANVAVDLLLWLAFTSLLTLAGLLGIAEGAGGSIFDYHSSRYYSTYADLLSAVTLKGQAILGLGALLT